MSVGRNELCPCGSGKKYKKCCGVVTPLSQARNLREQRMRNEYAHWIGRFNTYVSTHLQDDQVEAAKAQFASETGLPQEQLMEQEWSAHFFNWLVFDRTFDQQTILQRFLESDGRKMPGECKDGLLHLSLGFYRIEQVSDEEVTVRDLETEQSRQIIDVKGASLQTGQILMGRLLSLGGRDQLFSGSLILQPQYQPVLHEHLQQMKKATPTDLYRFVFQSGPSSAESNPQDALIRRTYTDLVDFEMIGKILEKHASFELKKRSNQQEVWVYAAQTEEYLFPALHDTLLELHEVAGEVLLQADSLVIEGFASAVEEIAQHLHLAAYAEMTPIQTISSTGTRLTRGTIFITSQPTLPSGVLQWAVQTYFTEKWLITPHPSLANIEPLLVAASDNEEYHKALADLVAHIEDESSVGQGPGRFMRIDMIRPRLAMPNKRVHIENLLKRPLIEGLPESVYTVSPPLLEEISAFVRAMTEGKSEATVKKYDEVMSLFRSFVRSAYGPSFTWSSLTREELAYFFIHDCLKRIDHPSKTLATNLLSVVSAFFKWLDKKHDTDLAGKLQPLISELRDDLPEAYRLRTLLQKEANHHLFDTSIAPNEVVEDALIVMEREAQGWRVRRSTGEEFILHLDSEETGALAVNWAISGVYGQAADGVHRMYGTPELYPPVVLLLLGIDVSALV